MLRFLFNLLTLGLFSDLGAEEEEEENEVCMYEEEEEE